MIAPACRPRHARGAVARRFAGRRRPKGSHKRTRFVIGSDTLLQSPVYSCMHTGRARGAIAPGAADELVNQVREGSRR